MNAERQTLMRDPHGPIHERFHQHMGSPDRLVNLIGSPLIRIGEVLAQAAGRLTAQDAVQLPVCRTGAMPISGLCRRHRNAPGVDRQIALQKPIRRLQSRAPCQPPLLDQSILHRLEQPLHPPLRLRGMDRDQLAPSSSRARPN